MTIQHAIAAFAAACTMAFLTPAAPNALGQSPVLIAADAETPADTETLADAETPAEQALQSGAVQNGLFLQGKETYRVVDTAGFRTAADVGETQTGAVAPVGYHSGFRSCGTSACGGACGGGGYGGFGAAGGSLGYGRVGTGISDPCVPCDPYCYVSVEALYMDNDSVGGFTLSPDFGAPDYDFEWGPRITIGQVTDCVHGYEASFTGPFEWNSRRSLERLPEGPIRTSLIPGAGISLLDLSSFVDFSEALLLPTEEPFPETNFHAFFQSQIFESEYWSIEASRTLNAGRFVRLLYGTRYISYDESYAYISVADGIAARPEVVPVPGVTPGRPAIDGRPAGAGRLLSRTSNDLYGLQVGIDMLFPVSCYGYTDLRARAGVYANSAENVFQLDNADAFVRAASDSTTALAGMFEFGAGYRYQVGEILSLRAGTEIWYLSGIAKATEQFSSTITNRTGSNTRDDGDVLFTGVSFGAELTY